MIKTQHCPNCEATEKKLHDFRQEVSDALYDYFGNDHIQWGGPLHLFIIPTSTPKPDPLVEVLNEMEKGRAKNWARDGYANKLRVTLADFGLEIREKNDD